MSERHEWLDAAAAYALDALDDAERLEFEQHLSGCAICEGEVTELRDTAASLAFAAPEVRPRAMLRQRILDEAVGARSVVGGTESPAALAPRSAAVGFGLAGGSYASSIDLYSGVRDSAATWDAGIGSYRNAWTAERVGVAVGATGSALLTAGLVRLIVDQVAAKDHARPRSALGASK